MRNRNAEQQKQWQLLNEYETAFGSFKNLVSFIERTLQEGKGAKETERLLWLCARWRQAAEHIEFNWDIFHGYVGCLKFTFYADDVCDAAIDVVEAWEDYNDESKSRDREIFLKPLIEATNELSRRRWELISWPTEEQKAELERLQKPVKHLQKANREAERHRKARRAKQQVTQ